MLYGVNDVSLLTGKTTWMEIQDALLSRAEYIAVKHTIGFNKIICSKQMDMPPIHLSLLWFMF